jgi:1,4-dihydroxy-2-naphthoyl-CoA synthase
MTLESEELLRIGFLTALVRREDLPAAIDKYAECIQRCDPVAVRSMKQHIDAIAGGEWNESIGRSAYETSLRSEETARRLAELAAR